MSEHDPQSDIPQAPVPPRVSDEDQAKARKFFAHARKAAETRNYDYAIKLYVDGLLLWPDAVDEGLKPLRVAATARRLDGGKPAGFLAARQRPTSGRDPLRNLNNALYLFGFDPAGIAHLETILQMAARARLPSVAAWIAPVLTDALNSAKKLSESHYQAACAAIDTAAEAAIAANLDQTAIDILNAGIAIAQIWAHHHPDSHDAPRARSNATGKLTIVKGRFAKAEGFTESLKDAEAQREIRDRDRSFVGAERATQLIARARQEWQANPDVPNKLFALVDLLIREEKEDVENEAIALLEREYQKGGQYVFRQKADDIRIRQLNRRQRGLRAALKTDPANPAFQQELADHVAAQTRAEIAILEDRHAHYPTDLRTKCQLGTRYFAQKRYDEAIPLLQQAQLDGRCRAESRLFIGRCFFEKAFHDQAVETFRAAVAELDSTTSPVALELNYWLGRALEAALAAAEARKVYGQLIQIDYNYRDARQRLETLVAAERQ
jgi:TolA-binding protein